MNHRILIITSYTDHIRWDNYGKCDYGDFASLNHHEYANLHGYSYIKELVRNSDYTDWHPTWIKIDVIKRYLPLFDYVAWIDADAVFVNHAVKIEDLVSGGVDLVIPKMEKDRLTGNTWTKTSTGFMVWKNSEWSSQTLNELWEDPQRFRFDFFHEQSRLDEMLEEFYLLDGGEQISKKSESDIISPVILDRIKIIPHSYHRCYPDGEMKYVYHAGGNTGTKLKRIVSVLSPSS